jgi:hypothetical protein
METVVEKETTVKIALKMMSNVFVVCKQLV